MRGSIPAVFVAAGFLLATPEIDEPSNLLLMGKKSGGLAAPAEAQSHRDWPTVTGKIFLAGA